MSHGKLMNDMEEAAERRIQAVEAEAAVLRQALVDVRSEISHYPDDAPVTVIDSVVAACRLIDAKLRATTAGQSLLDELQQLREVRDDDRRTLYEVRAICRDATMDAFQKVNSLLAMLEKYAPSTTSEGPKEVPHG